MNKTGRLRALALATLLACATGLLPARAGASELAWSLGSLLSTVVYAPAKAAYAATGLLVGGIGWGLSGGNRDVMDAVSAPAVGGDYWVTPAHLRGERRLEFVGPGPGRAAPLGAVADGVDADAEAAWDLEQDPYTAY